MSMAIWGKDWADDLEKEGGGFETLRMIGGKGWKMGMAVMEKREADENETETGVENWL
jgi:hypothetical protein